ncbi:hypothetical protein HMPREF1405_00703 [Helicobacter pylori GAM231Ai]|nr:hypothetical protein HMPREF1405_00703 [Helicobacter pylori GAM231Ai]
MEHCSAKSFFFFFCHLEKILEFCNFYAFVWVVLERVFRFYFNGTLIIKA